MSANLTRTTAPRATTGLKRAKPEANLQTACEITFPGKIPGNNGKGGLLRLHWASKPKMLLSP